jgi:hypothetical protein
VAGGSELTCHDTIHVNPPSVPSIWSLSASLSLVRFGRLTVFLDTARGRHGRPVCVDPSPAGELDDATVSWRMTLTATTDRSPETVGGPQIELYIRETAIRINATVVQTDVAPSASGDRARLLRLLPVFDRCGNATQRNAVVVRYRVQDTKQ